METFCAGGISDNNSMELQSSSEALSITCVKLKQLCGEVCPALLIVGGFDAYFSLGWRCLLPPSVASGIGFVSDNALIGFVDFMSVDMKFFNKSGTDLGRTALHWAIETANHTVINTLLKCGASLVIKNKNGQTAREMAEAQKKRYTVDLIKVAEREQQRISECYIKAKLYGTVLVQLVTVLLVGSQGVGKSSLSYCLLRKMLPKRRRSSGNATFSSKSVAIPLKDNTFTWTELSFEEELDGIANIIAPLVSAELEDSQTKQPSTKMQKIMKGIKKSRKVIKLPLKLSNSYNASKKHHPLVKQSSSLDETVIAKVASSDVAIASSDELKSFITIVDSGGQKAFLNLYPMFVRNPSVVMIVFKLTDDPDCIWKPLPKEEFHTADGVFTDLHQISHSTADLIKHTIANISTYADVSDASVSTHICCVGTHKDTMSPAAINAIDQQLTDLVQESGYAPLVVKRNGKSTKTLFPINNLVAGYPSLEDEAIQELRAIPHTLLSNENLIHEIPIRWMDLELQIREKCRLSQVKCMPYKSGLEIALNDFAFDDETEFLNMLKYFHNLSVLLYYHNISHLNDVIIVDNNSILDKVSKLVEFTFTGKGVTSCDFNNFKYCGVFSEKLLSHPNLEDEIDPRGLLQLLISMNVVSPLADQLYFMPCVLPSVEEFTESADDFLTERYGLRQCDSLHVQFSSRSIPRGVFCSLVVCLMNSEKTAKRWMLCRSLPNHKEVFCNLATFTLPTGHRVTIHDRMSHCEIQIRHKSPQSASPIHHDVLNTIMDSLHDVCATMCLCAVPLVGFQCSNDQCSHSKNSFVLSKVSLPLQTSDAYSICNLSYNLNRLTSDQEVWFKLLPVVPVAKPPNMFREELNKICSNHTCSSDSVADDVSELLTYSSDWTTEWMSIGTKLDMPEQRLKEIWVDNKPVRNCCREMLVHWVRSAVSSCYCKLVTALDELNLTEAAFKIAKDKLIPTHAL